MSSTQSGSRTQPDAEVSTSTGVPASSARNSGKRSDRERRLFEPGDKVSDRYRILRFIARGGMGEVYAALDAELGQPVALKAVRPEVALHSQTLRRFRREINLSRKVTHQNVCRIYDVGTHYAEEQDLSIRYLTMELLEGLTLTRYLRKHGTVAPDEALPIVVQIASGLGAAHDAGVVHRDFKTSNVLLAETSRGLRAVITDFGLSQTLNDDGLTPVDSDRLTGTGQLMGTLAYLAPEQLEGKPSSAATDIYSLGVVLYQMLTGRLPFDGGSPLMAALKRLHEDPPDPRKFKPELDDVWCEVILRCLERDPTKRYQNTEELMEALGVEALTDSSTSMMRPIVDRRRGYASGAYEAPSVDEPPAGMGTGSREIPLPRGTLPMWKAVALAIGAALVVLGFTHVLPRLLAPPDIQVLVAEPVVLGENADFLASSFEAAVLRGLASLEGIHPLDSSKIEGVEGAPEELLRTAGADELIHLEVRDIGREWGVTVKRIGPGGEVLFLPDNFKVVQDDSRLQADALQAAVLRLYPDRDVIEGAGDLEISSDDYAEFLDLRYAVEEGPKDTTWLSLLDQLGALRRRAPDFPEASIYEARAAAYLYRVSRDEDYLAQAFSALDRARKRIPKDPRPIEQEFGLAIISEDTERAASSVAKLRQIAPGEVTLLRAEARLAKAQGQLDLAVDKMSRACEIQRSARCLQMLSTMLLENGQTEKARKVLTEVVENWPAYLYGPISLAELELRYGNLQAARELYEKALDPLDPNFTVSANLGIIYMIQQDYEKAVDIYRSIQPRFPGHPAVVLGLADAEQLVGNRTQAEVYYRQVLDLVPAGSASDWSDWSARAQAQAHLQLKEPANFSVEKSLELGKDQGEAHLLAALVYQVLDQQDRAEEAAGTAQRLGVPSHFFQLPWLRDIQIPGA